MKLSFKTLSGLFFLALLVYGAIWIARLVWFRPPDLNHFLFRSLYEQYQNDPESLSKAHAPTLDKMNVYNHALTDPTFRFSPKQKQQDTRILEQLHGYGYASLPATPKLSYDIAEATLNSRLTAWPFLPQENVVAPFYGIQNQTPIFLAYYHRIRDRQEAHNYLLRLDEVKKKVDGLITLLRSQEKQNLLPPKFLLEKTLSEVKAFTAIPYSENLVYTSFGKRAILTHYQSYNEGEAARHMGMIKTRMEKGVYPSYKKLAKELDRLIAVAPETFRPLSKEAYKACLNRYAGTTMSPDSLADFGKKGISTLQQQLQEELVLMGKPKMEALGAMGPFLHKLTDSLQHQQSFISYQDELRAIMFDAKEKIQGAIPAIPQKDIIHFHPFADFQASHAPDGHYLPASIDDSRQANLLLHSDKNRMVPPWRMRTFAYRNLVPGTHWRWSFQLENEELPLFRKLGDFPDYEASWRAYSSFLADELGFHKIPNGKAKPHPYSWIGYLQSRLIDAAGCVVDPGIHAQGWDREKAIGYFEDIAGISRKEAERRTDDIIARPGTGCAAHLGLERIRALRERAKAEMGLSYTPAAFHTLLLSEGAMPMEVLEKRVESWIEKGVESKNK